MAAPQPKKVLHLPRIRMLRGGRVSSGIRIRSIRPATPATPATPVTTASPQDDQEKETPPRNGLCAYPHYECLAPVLSGRRYCGEHILCDPTAPYTRCSHVYPGGDVCKWPAPYTDRPPQLCLEHARAALVARQRAAAPPPPVTTTETLLNQLQHYVKAERPRTTSCASSVSVVSDPAEPEATSPVAVDPFKLNSEAINASFSSTLLDCASASESDGDDVTLGRGGNCRYTHFNPLAEDAPTEDKPLWRAGIFTAEEAISETKAVLCELQAAYFRQVQRCDALLKIARKDYLKALKLEKEQYSSINAQARSGPLSVRERKQLRKLKAFASYHKKHGVDAVLARKLQHKRIKAETGGRERITPGFARCIFSEGGVRCVANVLPAAKYCYKHILHNTQQVLFTACGDSRGGVQCAEVVARLPLPSATCRYHTDPPPYTTFSLKKEETDSCSESDTDASVFDDAAVTSLHS